MTANKWRAVTFETVLTTAFPRGNRKGTQPVYRVMVREFKENRNAVGDKLRDVLIKRFGQAVVLDVDDEITKIVKNASELALEFGSQRALVGLEIVDQGRLVNNSQGFEDVKDGDMHRNMDLEVSVMVSPKLYRIGDGRTDLKAEKIICPGQVYSVL